MPNCQATHFNHYYKCIVSDYQKNANRLSYHTFSQKSERATRPLTCANEAQFYTAAYAMQHYQSFMTLLQQGIGIKLNQGVLNVVDYGCGQGVATLALLDFIATQITTDICLNIHLLEPSSIALNNAKELIIQRAKDLEIRINLTSQNTSMAHIHLPKHIIASEDSTVHLFSNVLDVVDVQLSLNSLAGQIRQMHGQSIVLASSPAYHGAYKGFCQLSALLTHNANPMIYNRKIEHRSYRIINRCWQTCTSPYIHMVLDVADGYYQQAA